jgi:hypothetical protein
LDAGHRNLTVELGAVGQCYMGKHDPVSPHGQLHLPLVFPWSSLMGIAEHRGHPGMRHVGLKRNVRAGKWLV